MAFNLDDTLEQSFRERRERERERESVCVCVCVCMCVCVYVCVRCKVLISCSLKLEMIRDSRVKSRGRGLIFGGEKRHSLRRNRDIERLSRVCTHDDVLRMTCDLHTRAVTKTHKTMQNHESRIRMVRLEAFGWIPERMAVFITACKFHVWLHKREGRD